MSHKSSLNIELIWHEFHDQLLGFITSKVADRSEAEDILQTVFMKILSKIDSLRDETKIKSWLYQITRNTIIDHFREKKKSEQNGIDPDISEETDENVNDEVKSWLLPMITALPEKYREALLLSEIRGMPQKELAEYLGLSYAGAKSRVQRGRAMIKERLTQCCNFNIDKYGNVLSYRPKDDCC